MTVSEIAVLKSPTIRENCGTFGGFKKHKRNGERNCDPCQAARREYEVSYVARNREKTAIQQARYYKENVERISKREKSARLANPEHKRELGKAWRLAHPERAREMSRDDYAKHKEKRKAAHALWRINNPTSLHRTDHARRARKRNAPSEPYTVQQILGLYGTDCHLCGEPIDLNAPRSQRFPGWERGLHLDHVIPLSKGGSNLISNVKPSHGKCNIAKKDTVAA